MERERWWVGGGERWWRSALFAPRGPDQINNSSVCTQTKTEGERDHFFILISSVTNVTSSCVACFCTRTPTPLTFTICRTDSSVHTIANKSDLRKGKISSTSHLKTEHLKINGRIYIPDLLHFTYFWLLVIGQSLLRPLSPVSAIYVSHCLTIMVKRRVHWTQTDPYWLKNKIGVFFFHFCAFNLCCFLCYGLCLDRRCSGRSWAQDLMC